MMTVFLKRDISLLALSIIAAIAARFLVLVVGRPAFVGWFNHSPYYWVQTRSLIESGGLAYGDMPLVFTLYAAVAKMLILFGVPLDDSVILSSRLVMVVAPGLIPIAVFVLARGVAGGAPLAWPSRCLVFASSFLPLTFANMPEVLQKNMIGLTLLSFCLVVLFSWLRDRRTSQLILLLGLLASTCLAHLGSGLAAFLLVTAGLADVTLRRSAPVEIARIVLLAATVCLVIATAIRTFDPGSWDRVAVASTALVPGTPGEATLSIIAIVVWLGLLFILWRWTSRRTAHRGQREASLARVILLWLGLLAMPLWPGEIGMRLLLFMPLGAVVLLVLLLQIFEGRIPKVLAAVSTIAFCIMSVGEATSVLLTYPNKGEISRQLAAAADKHRFSKDDLIITPYGVTPIANWFLGTKASLITAIEEDMHSRYKRIFVLNTLERPAPELADGECRVLQSANDRYRATRHDTPVASETGRDPGFSEFALYQLDEIPEDWLFDDEGRWVGWGACTNSRYF